MRLFFSIFLKLSKLGTVFIGCGSLLNSSAFFVIFLFLVATQQLFLFLVLYVCTATWLLISQVSWC